MSLKVLLNALRPHAIRYTKSLDNFNLNLKPYGNRYVLNYKGRRKSAPIQMICLTFEILKHVLCK